MVKAGNAAMMVDADQPCAIPSTQAGGRVPAGTDCGPPMGTQTRKAEPAPDMARTWIAPPGARC